MDSKSRRAAQELLREDLCLDFVNPVVVDAEKDYFFVSYGNLLDWGIAVGTVTEAEAATLRSAAEASGRAGQEVLSRAMSVRATLDAVLRARAMGSGVGPFLADLDHALADATAHRRLSVRHDRVTWEWPMDGDPGKVFWPVIPSAVDLLMTPAPANLKVCPGCGWLFLDSSKNRSRKWCRMSDCGNVAKVRSLRQRRS